MGNKMEHFKTEVQEFRCPCGKGIYRREHDTYMDDYGNKDFKTSQTMDCPECSSKYVESGYRWISRELDAKITAKSNDIKEHIEMIMKYIRSKYYQQLLDHVSAMTMVSWHREWSTGRSIGTFRKDIKRRGKKRVFDDLTCFPFPDHMTNLYRTMKLAQIEDPQVEAWIEEYTRLDRELTVLKEQDAHEGFSGDLIREYDRW